LGLVLVYVLVKALEPVWGHEFEPASVLELGLVLVCVLVKALELVWVHVLEPV
jgi:hypothetical protein